MKRRARILGWLALALCWCVPHAGTHLAAQGPAPEPFRCLSSDERGILLEWTSAAFEVETVERGGRPCQCLIVPGTVPRAVPGAPLVPVRGALLGVPPAALAEANLSVEILELETERLRLGQLCPAPTLRLESGSVVERHLVDPRFYGRDALYPRRPVEIGTTGYLRDQAVAKVQVSPLAYNPVRGEARFYRRIVARVTWDSLPSQPSPPRTEGTEGERQEGEARWASPAFEGVLHQALLNYEMLNRPPPQLFPVQTPGERGDLALPPVVYTGETEGEQPPALKIGVTEEGIYQLTYSQIAGAGFDVEGLDPRAFRLTYQDVEMPISVQGKEDGSFDPGDTILFYGTALRDVYSRVKVYWLTAGDGPGLRFETREGGTFTGAPLATYSPATQHVEQDTFYWSTMPDGEGQDHWFWGDKLTAPDARTYTLTLPHLSSAVPTATLRVQLKGRTDLMSAPDHHTRLTLNGTQIDDQRWDGFSSYEHRVTISRDLLRDGQNLLLVQGIAEEDVLVDQFHLDWIEVHDAVPLIAEGGELLFGAPRAGRWQFHVTGLNGSESDVHDVAVYDVTDPARAVRIEHVQVVGSELRFEDDAGPGSRYLAVDRSGFKTPDSVVLDAPSDWRSPAHGADYLLITAGRYYPSALRLAEHRRAQGLRVALIDVQDLYDEYNGGMLSPISIRDFLAYAYQHWQAPAPTYVTLLGGATYDYRDLLGLYRKNDVPTRLIETYMAGQIPSDNWLAAVHGDDVLPDLLIGRLTALSPMQAEDVVDKVIRYDDLPRGAWNQTALFVADDDELVFEQNAQENLERLPLNYQARQVYLNRYPPGDPQADILGAIDDGAVLVQYHGHGNVYRWGTSGTEPVLDRADVQTLNNQEKWPLVAIAACYTANFTNHGTSIAETFLGLKDRGAAAVWAGSGLGYASGHRVLMNALYEAIYQDDLYGLGEATTAAKVATLASSSYWSEMVQTYVLLGDPATSLAIPPNVPYLTQTLPAAGAQNVPIDQEIALWFSKPMDPATVLVRVEGAPDLTLIPAWTANQKQVIYTHSGLEYGQQVTVRVSGQDRLGNPLGAGLVPSAWSFVTRPQDPAPAQSILYLPLALRP